MMTFDMKRASLQRSRRMLAAAFLGVTALVAGWGSPPPAALSAIVSLTVASLGSSLAPMLLIR